MVKIYLELNDSDYAGLVRMNELLAKLPKPLTADEMSEIAALLKLIPRSVFPSVVRAVASRTATNVEMNTLQTAIFDCLPLFPTEN